MAGLPETGSKVRGGEWAEVFHNGSNTWTSKWIYKERREKDMGPQRWKCSLNIQKEHFCLFSLRTYQHMIQVFNSQPFCNIKARGFPETSCSVKRVKTSFRNSLHISTHKTFLQKHWWVSFLFWSFLIKSTYVRTYALQDVNSHFTSLEPELTSNIMYNSFNVHFQFLKTRKKFY